MVQSNIQNCVLLSRGGRVYSPRITVRKKGEAKHQASGPRDINYKIYAWESKAIEGAVFLEKC